MSEGQQSRSPEASLGLLDATMIGMGAMIGAGIFVLTGLAADLAGPAAVIVFGLNGLVTLFTALSYAELASAIPKSGGGYAFVQEVYDEFVSFQMGWMLWFAYMIAGALYALGFAPNFVELVHIYWEGLPAGGGVTIAYAVLAVAGLVALNAVSTAASGSVETVFTGVKVSILVVFVAFGALAPADPGAQFQPLFADGGALAILPAMGLTFIAFEGYDLITTVTEEVKNPRENIPTAIFVSLGITVLVYLAVVSVAVANLGAVKLGEAGETGIAEAAKSFMPEIPLLGGGEALIVFGAVFSTITALNAVVIASSRVAFSMGREGQLLPRFGQLHHRYGTPFVAILASAVVMLATPLALPTESAGYMSSLFFLLSFVVVNLAVIRLRRERPDMRRPYEVPYFPVPPVLGVALNLLLTGVLVVYLVGEDPLALVASAAWLALGAVVYYALERVGEESVPATGGTDTQMPAEAED
jgi:amino acid transporter